MRDYAADMNAWMVQAVKRLPPNAGIVARQIVAELRRKDPDLLDGWLRLQAEDSLRRELQHLVTPPRKRRIASASAPAHSASRNFREAALALKAGDGEPLQGVLQRSYQVDGTTMRLGSMTAPHLRSVAQGFARSADRARMEAAFLEALANKCEQAKATVGDLYDEQTITTMWHNITRSASRST